MSKSRIGRSLVPMVAAAALLSGCGGGITAAETPAGVAVRVGDDVISQTTVNDAAQGLCASVEKELTERDQAVTMKRVKQVVVGLLTNGAQARQIAEEYDVAPGPEVVAQRQQLERDAADMSDEVRKAYVQAVSTEQLLPSVLAQVGELALRRDGVTKPTQDQIMARGSDILATWPASHEIQVDPRYSMVVTKEGLQFGDTGLSVAVSDVAVDAMLQMTDPEAADPQAPASLPESQRCG